MVDVEQLVDPELEGLLQELGSRPRSVFLRSSRKEALRVLRSRTTPGISALAVPDALERELLTVHRDELAEILRQACRTKLLEGKRERLFVLRYRTATERVDPIPLGRIEARMEHASRSAIAEPWMGAVSSIGAALSVSDVEDLSVPELAALGQKLQPGDTWRVMCAMAYLAHGEICIAREMSRTVLDGWSQIEDALRALEIASMAELLDGSVGQALQTQEHACALRVDHVIGHLNRLVFAILLHDSATAIDASSRLESLIKADHPMIAATKEVNHSRWQADVCRPTADTLRFARALGHRLGSVAREVVSVVA